MRLATWGRSGENFAVLMRARKGWLKNSRNAIYSGVMSAIIYVVVIIYLCFYVVVALYFNLGIFEVE